MRKRPPSQDIGSPGLSPIPPPSFCLLITSLAIQGLNPSPGGVGGGCPTVGELQLDCHPSTIAESRSQAASGSGRHRPAHTVGRSSNQQWRARRLSVLSRPREVKRRPPSEKNILQIWGKFRKESEEWARLQGCKNRAWLKS